ncbi:hypothetical protein M1437_04845, partial [Patescibacteria group bacterium]|nr:hypothetical protein [Patescibacteria group bacterium]
RIKLLVALKENVSFLGSIVDTISDIILGAPEVILHRLPEFIKLFLSDNLAWFSLCFRTENCISMRIRN